MARPRDRPGGRAFRCTRLNKKNYVGIKAAVLLTKGLHWMHWHACVARSVVLALTLLMTQATRYACVCCEQLEHGTFTSAFPSPTIRAAFLSEKKLRWDKADQHHRGLLLCSRPSPRLAASNCHQSTGSSHCSTHFCKQNVGVGYTRYIYIYTL